MSRLQLYVRLLNTSIRSQLQYRASFLLQTVGHLLITGGEFPSREYLTCRYGNSVWYRDDRTWFFSLLDFTGPRVFDLEADPDCARNIAEKAPDRISLARERILADAGGELPHHDYHTDAIGRPPANTA